MWYKDMQPVKHIVREIALRMGIKLGFLGRGHALPTT